MRSLFAVFFLASTLGLFVGPGVAQAEEVGPSFACDKASTAVEHAICASEVLSDLDRSLSHAFRAAMQDLYFDSPEEWSLRIEQRQWNKERQTKCASVREENSKYEECLARIYRMRIAALMTASVSLAPTKAKNTPLAIADGEHVIDVDGDVPQVCVRFSQVLAAVDDVTLRSFVSVTPEEDYAVEQRGNLLCFNGLRHGAHYEVLFKAGLSGDAGKLPHAETRQLLVPEREASVSFAKRAYVLPKVGRNSVVPVTTVNRDEIPLTLYRIGERNLLSVLTSSDYSSLDGYDSRALRDSLGQEIWTGKVKIENTPNKEVVTQIPISELAGDLKSGLYILAEKKGERRWTEMPTQWFVVSDIGLSSYLGENGFSVQVRALSSAKTLSNVVVRVVGTNNMILAENTTDRNGWAGFSGALGQAKGGMRPLYVTADTEDGDFVFLALNNPAFDLSSHGVSGRTPPGPLEAFAYSDRGIYRPGETVRVGILLRDDKGRAVPSLPLTAVIKRPDGEEHSRQTVNLDRLGGGLFDVDIISSAQTGRWSVDLYAETKSPVIGNVGFQVEEFVPEKLKVAIEPYAGGKINGSSAGIVVQADYLFGAPGSNLIAGGNAILRLASMPFPYLKDFRFGLSDEIAQKIMPFEEVTTDAAGVARLTLSNIELPDHTAPLEVRVLAEVSDSDGRPNRGYGTIPIRTHDRFIGLKPGFAGASVGFGEAAAFTAVMVDHEGKPLANTTVTVRWIDENRDYRWYYSNNEWRVNFSKNDIEMKSRIMRTDASGQITFEHTTDRWGHFRVEVYDVAGAAATDFVYRVGWSVASRAPDTPDMLELSLDKTDVQLGETIEGVVKGPFAGRATVVVANKSVLWRDDIKLNKDGSSFSIPVTEDWGVGAYVMVTAYRPGENIDQRGPGRAVGLSWVSVGRMDKSLNVSFTVPDEVEPNRSITIPIVVEGTAVENGDPTKAAIFAVDEGILRLTQYQAPNPSEALLGQQRLQLLYRDLYGRLIAPLEGRPGMVETGGDEAGNLGGVDKRVFKTVALTAGLIDIGADGKGEATFVLPDFNGQLRLFAVAYSAGAVGGGKSSLLVRDKVVAELLPPRFLAPGDIAKTTLRVTNVAGSSGAYDISLNAAGPVEVLDASQQLTLAKGETKTTTFELIGRSIGNALLTLNVSGPDGLSVERTVDISVRAAQPWVSERRLIDLGSGRSHDIRSDSLDSFLPNTGSVLLSISSFPQIDVATLVTELDRYPYGCLEQTTSATLPLLYFGKLKELWPEISYDEATLKDRVSYGVERILSIQRTDGSFGLWTSNSEPEPWLTAYATDFLLEAKRLGHNVPGAPLSKALDWMEGELSARNGRPSAMAYWTKVLSQAGRLTPEEVSYNQAQIALEPWDAFGKASLAAAGLQRGDSTITMSLRDFSRAEAWKPSYWRSYYYNYGSQLRDVAAALAQQPSVFVTEEDQLRALEALIELYEAKRYTSTQEKGWLIRAALAVLDGSTGPTSFSLDGLSINKRGPYTVTYTSLKDRGGVTLQNNNEAPLFVTQTVTGIPANPIRPHADGFTIEREYFDENGEPVDPSTVAQGTRMIVKLSITHESGFKKRALVVDLLPAGFEIEPASIGGLTSVLLDKHFKDRDEPVFKAERDDRYVAAYDLPKAEGTITSVYVVRAAIPGSYIHPAPSVEDMYKPEYSAIGKIGAVTVTEGAPN